MKNFMIAVILLALGLLGYNIYAWDAKSSKKSTREIHSLTIHQKPHLVKTQRVGMNWDHHSYEVVKTLQPGYLRTVTTPDNALEFITFARKFNSTPWLIIPSDLPNENYYFLGHLLKEEKFNHVVVEMDNHHPELVENAFRYLTDGYGKGVSVKKVLNAPNIQIDQLLSTLENVPSADYILVETNQNLKQLANKIRKLGKNIAVDDKTIAGSLLGKQWIEQLGFKIQPQVVTIKNNEDSAALALKMMNSAIFGAAHKIHQENKDSKITGIAFKSTSKWSAAIYNDSDAAENVELEFPNDNRLVPHEVLTLSGENDVKIKRGFAECCKNRLVTFQIPAHSFVVLPPQHYLTNNG